MNEPDHIQAKPTKRSTPEIQANPPPGANDALPVPDYDFRNHSRGRVGSRLRYVGCVALLLIVVGGYLLLARIPPTPLGNPPFTGVVIHLPPAPPLSEEEARQALVEFVANEPLMAPFPAVNKAIPDVIPEKDENGRVKFGKYTCELSARSFYFVNEQYRRSWDGVGGDFVFENGVWKAKIRYSTREN